MNKNKAIEIEFDLNGHIDGTPWTLEKITKVLSINKIPYKPLFSEYLGQKVDHEWLCLKCGKKFFANWKRLLKTVKGFCDGGCLRCANRLSYTIEQVRKELKKSKRPIISLNKVYKNNKERMLWKCTDCGHEWKTSWKNIKGTNGIKGQGCIVCANNVKYTIEKINQIIIEKKKPLVLLSEKYENGQSKLLWKCSKCNNEFKMSWVSINCAGKGCPLCATNSNIEIKIRDFLNQVFGEETFIKTKPEFLKNPKTNRLLEIDCYSEKLNLAIEVNGPYHYEFSKIFHRDKEYFNQIKKRDRNKKKILKDKKINFIIVDVRIINYKQIKKNIKTSLIKLGYDIPPDFDKLSLV